MNVEPLQIQRMTKILAMETWLILALFARMFLLILGFKEIASALFMLIHVLALLIGVKYVVHVFAKGLKRERFAPLVIFAIMALYIGAVYLVNRLRPVSLEELPVTLLIVCLLIAALDGSIIYQTVFKFYFKCSIVASVVLTFAAFIPDFYKEGSLLLYTANENQAGIIYMCMFMNMMVYLQLKKRFSLSYFLVILVSLGTFIGCCMTHSRTSIACCVLVVLVYLVFKHKSKPFSSIIIILIMTMFVCLPFLVVYVLPRLGININAITTGRDGIWLKVISESFASPFKANFTDPIFPYSVTYGQQINAHNVLLELTWRYSMPIGVFFIIFMFLIISKTNKLVGRNRFSMMLFATLIICLVHMCFEASLISGALDFSLYIVLPLVMGYNFELKSENKRRKNKMVLKEDSDE